MARLHQQAIHGPASVRGDGATGLRGRRSGSSRLLMLAGAAVFCLSLAGPALSATAAQRIPLTVVVLGKGADVTSRPVGISCPGHCTASFTAGSHVVLSAKPKSGFRLQRWAGSCKGSGACTVKVSSPAAVTAVFERSSAKPSPHANPSPTPGAKLAEPGFYSVNGNSYNWLFADVGSRRVLNVEMGVAAPIACTPAATGAPTTDWFLIPQAALRRDGSFTATFSQSGMFDGSPATYKYHFAGRFTPATATSAASAAGTYREDIVFRDNVTHRCTTNNAILERDEKRSDPPADVTPASRQLRRQRQLLQHVLSLGRPQERAERLDQGRSRDRLHPC